MLSARLFSVTTTTTGVVAGCRRSLLSQLARPVATPAPVVRRLFASEAVKPSMSLLAKLRKETQCSISKGKDALVATGNDYAAALEWLERDMAESGAKKAAKLGSRVAAEGLIGVTVHPNGQLGSIVELNSETDFVAKSEPFCDLVKKMGAATLVWSSEIKDRHDPIQWQQGPSIHPLDVEAVLDFPVVPLPDAAPAAEAAEAPKSCKETIVDVIGKLGENIRFRRAALAMPSGDFLKTAQSPVNVVGGYVHSQSGVPAGLGRIGALVQLKCIPVPTTQAPKVQQFARQLAQHIVGFAPTVKSTHELPSGDQLAELAGGPDQVEAYLDQYVLLRQPFLMGGGSVEQVLATFSQENGVQLSIDAFVRYECGDGIEKKADNFAEEVARQVGTKA
ncbi:elongation factor TS-domain-containing protein [Polychytrium aggregatum]|uniref:elongation factor TS-domain-containing protein n=1 Tax=Polychytrium aggregatum TaxID=110093 RepID=UPI0022FEA193|nr:elongation factor TS-domain-containing protein [Polychytrium aggregatum]KAI9203265.1 elongation factor TS-domain-containing protein [Polychytrium aggregatum]